MDVARAIRTAREWNQGGGMQSFWQSGRILNETHRDRLLAEVTKELGFLKEHWGQPYSGDPNSGKYGERDKADLLSLKEVAETAQEGEELSPPARGVDVEQMKRAWKPPKPQTKPQANDVPPCTCPECEVARAQVAEDEETGLIAATDEELDKGRKLFNPLKDFARAKIKMFKSDLMTTPTLMPPTYGPPQENPKQDEALEKVMNELIKKLREQ